MSARDDYPAIAVHSRWPGEEGRQCGAALDEIDRLRAIPPHPAHIPFVVAPAGAIVRTENGWLLVLPEFPEDGL